MTDTDSLTNTLAAITDDAATSRRRALRYLGGAGIGLLAVACDQAATTSSTSTTDGGSSSSTTTAVAGATTTTATAGTTTCAPIPEETAGPYPGDGSNGVNVLDDAGIVRSDIRSSFGSSTTTATGVPLTITLTVVDTSAGCAPLAGAAVYLWHCDIDGRYSLYSSGVTNENYLRGVQVTDANGQVTFQSIFPACYSGRWPHAHFEVYPDVTSITSSRNKIATSQLAFPKAICDTVYASSGYSQSVTNLSRVSLAGDNVFGDGATQETPSVTGSVADGYTTFLTVPVAA